MVNGFLAVKKNRPVHAGWERSSIISTTTINRSTHFRSSNPNLNTPSRIHLIARSAQGSRAHDSHQRRTFRSRSSPSPQRWAVEPQKDNIFSNRPTQEPLIA